jgi:hypothetical protein
MLLRWANAKEQMKAAHLCCDYQLYDESIACSYYALLASDVGSTVA